MTEMREACGGGNEGILCLVVGGFGGSAGVGELRGEVCLAAPEGEEVGFEVGGDWWSGVGGASREGLDAVDRRLAAISCEALNLERRFGVCVPVAGLDADAVGGAVEGWLLILLCEMSVGDTRGDAGDIGGAALVIVEAVQEEI